eukprot:jgi/Botrbrau1/18486/Bobra.0072s0066.1
MNLRPEAETKLSTLRAVAGKEWNTDLQECLHLVDYSLKEEERALVKLFTKLGKKKLIHKQDSASRLELDIIRVTRHLQQSSKNIKANLLRCTDVSI